MMKQSTMLFILLLMGMLMGGSREAAADACTVTGITFAMPSTLVVPRDLPVGAQIGPEFVTNTYTAFSNCTKTTTGWVNVGHGTNSPYVQSIPGVRLYATGIPGISYALQGGLQNYCTAAYYYIGVVNGFNGNPNAQNLCATAGVWSTVTYRYTIRFYKTASTTGSGTVGALAAGYAFMHFPDSGFISPNSNLTVTGLAVKTTACSVSNSVINVKLGPTKVADFGDVGSTSGSKAFGIDLNNCDAGLNLSMTLSPGSGGSSDKDLGLLTADTTSSANGLALQLMYNNAPVKLDTAFSVLGSTTTSGGSYHIPLAVRYYKTATQLKSGTVNASATFTMTYN
ncbi:hypothetical protein Z042_16165 [Chania multitudinisentens RB-25]|uniref:Fimbrial-type adhesion domain-containing protein n=1 Tax=Chania multitudinisentens RB-25 TaxID=1441930 RepID=W0LGA8_9GAMM|nr:fimbrial protein [Chania multitudinisentens]AHG22868.1 hypothetical protein Z042_16165 [Chania multitudinisentens RB-25]